VQQGNLSHRLLHRYGPARRAPESRLHVSARADADADITSVYIVLRDGKWDIPAYLQGGRSLDMHLAYLMIDMPFGAPYTVSRVVSFAPRATIAFGFPDMIFHSHDIFTRLLARQRARPADLILGLFPAEEGRPVDMVELREDGRVRRLVVQPPDTRLRETWGVAVWSPAFSTFLQAYVGEHADAAESQPEASMGSVIQSAVEAGLSVEAITVCDTPYLDIGTPEGLLAAQRRAAAELDGA
jgi:glucose-1-phosphate thymidylyltransferase